MLRRISCRWTVAASAMLAASSFSTISNAADPPPNKVPEAAPAAPAAPVAPTPPIAPRARLLEIRRAPQIFVVDQNDPNIVVPAPPPNAVGPGGIVRSLIDARPPANVVPSKYMVGVALGEVPAYVWKQLKREGQSGVVVTQVLPDTPAQAAGIQENDILLKANDIALAGQNDLTEVVRESEGKEIKLQLLRNGEEMALSVTPTANEQPATSTVNFTGDGRWEVVNFGPGLMVQSDQKVTELKSEIDALRQQVDALQKAVDALQKK